MKKRSIVQKLFAIAAAAALSLSLSACNGNSVSSSDGPGVTPGGSQESSQPNGGKTYKVAIIKQMDHASLDEIAQAVERRLDEIAAQNGVAIQHETTSGQNDQGTLKQLADQAIADGADVIIPIATTAAKIAALSAGETKTPVVFAAVSYPAEESVALTGLDYVTGTSDALNTKFIIDLMLAQNPELSKVGLLYCLSEDNSATPIAEAKEYLDSKSIPYSVQTANSNDEVVAAVCARLPERLHQAVRDILDNWHQDIPPLDGVYDLVKELKGKGYRIYLLSNTCTRFHEFRKNIPALEFFDGEFVSCDFHFVKPEPGIYLRFLEYFHLRPEECVFIDDDPRNIEGAVRCGMGGVIYHGDPAHLRLRLRELGVDADEP